LEKLADHYKRINLPAEKNTFRIFDRPAEIYETNLNPIPPDPTRPDQTCGLTQPVDIFGSLFGVDHILL